MIVNTETSRLYRRLAKHIKTINLKFHQYNKTIIKLEIADILTHKSYGSILNKYSNEKDLVLSDIFTEAFPNILAG